MKRILGHGSRGLGNTDGEKVKSVHVTDVNAKHGLIKYSLGDFSCFRGCHVQQQQPVACRAGSDQVLPQNQRQSHEDCLGARRQ